MKTLAALTALLLLSPCVVADCQSATRTGGWALVWSDEFNGKRGETPDRAKWTYDVGGDGWGNQELEYYTKSPRNASLDGRGHLVIRELREPHDNRTYTSARIKTQGLFANACGRFEARIRIPHGQGIWPAFWLLGDDIDTAGWPGCGEIDIMENIGKEPATVYGSAHGPGYDSSVPYKLPGGKPLSAGYHTYAVEWSPTHIQWLLDGVAYATYDRSQMPAGKKWVFDHPFFILLNVAVGGSWPGNPDATTRFPQRMEVDYVRVYRAAP